MIYLIYGEEKYDLYKFIDKIKSSFSDLQIGINLFYISKENLNELENISNTVSFLDTNKLIIIKNTELKLDIKFLKDQINSEDIYIIVEDNVDKRTVEYKDISKIAEVTEFKHLNSKEMTSYVISVFKMYNIQISYDDADYFVQICGEDKSNNINEMNKIVSYLNSSGKVTKQIIDDVCSKTLSAKLFTMLEFAINKEKKKAIRMLDELFDQKEPAIKITIMLYKQIKQIYMIKYLKDRHCADINKILEIHPFAFSKLLKASERYELNYLGNILNKFDELDRKTKIGEMDFEIGLKEIICLL